MHTPFGFVDGTFNAAMGFFFLTIPAAGQIIQCTFSHDNYMYIGTMHDYVYTIESDVYI